MTRRPHSAAGYVAARDRIVAVSGINDLIPSWHRANNWGVALDWPEFEVLLSTFALATLTEFCDETRVGPEVTSEDVVRELYTKIENSRKWVQRKIDEHAAEEDWWKR